MLDIRTLALPRLFPNDSASVRPKGAVQLFRDGEVAYHPNQVMASGMDLLIRALCGDASACPSTLYLEFENGTLGAITEPSFTAADDRSYYDALSTPRDYLRVPLTQPTEFDATGADYSTNRGYFIGYATEGVGVHGLEFSAAAGSRIFGGAIVAAPIAADPSSDILYARTYWGADPWEEISGKQTGARWFVSLTLA